MNTFVRFFVILVLLIIGIFYHIYGMNDWFAMQAVNGDITLVQAANEIIASVHFAAALILMAIWSTEDRG